jgi:hypothetical protein
MNTPLRLAAFGAGLAVVFAGAVGVGNAVGRVGPISDEPHSAAHGGEESTAGQAAAPSGVDGVSLSADGYRLRLDAVTHPLGTTAPFAFSVLGPDGDTVTAFSPTHDKELHLIVVRRDSTGFQHVHPQRDAAGRWSVPLTLDDAGVYKVFADFAPEGRSEALTLAADVSVAGGYEPRPLPAPSRTAVVDGYTVTLTGELVPGRESELTLSVSRDGRPVADLQPYLGAFGHLVALRAGDLAYLHVHPEDDAGRTRTTGGPDITFLADVPTPGDYRLYLDFQHGGEVRTAEFTATAAERRAADAPAPEHDDTSHAH